MCITALLKRERERERERDWAKPAVLVKSVAGPVCRCNLLCIYLFARY